jgi:ABC-2 type transport system permease protein
MSTAAAARPYVALFTSRFQLMLQYRGAAVAGFITQCWWGGLKAMILAAFYGAAAAGGEAPLTLEQAITYTWIAQGLFAMLPWMGDPEVALAVRTGAVSYDRLRPLDFYGIWYSRAAGWIAARLVPRTLLMFAFAAVLLPLVGLERWAWQPPESVSAGALFVPSLLLALLFSTAIVMLINVAIAGVLKARGIIALMGAPVIVFSGSLLPLSLFPEWLQVGLILQPLASLLDIPLRIYFGQLWGWSAAGGLALQALWATLTVLVGRALLARVLRNLEMQGG